MPAAWLIEKAGLPKGSRMGPVGNSPHHALALVNHGGAKAADVLAFADRVRRAVFEGFGVTLTPEPHLVNCALPRVPLPLSGA